MLAAVVLCALPAALSSTGGPVFAGIAARDPSLDAQADRVAVALGQALEKRGGVDLGSPPLPDTVDDHDATLATLVSSAKTKYLEGDFAAANEKASDAVTRFESGGAFRTGPAWSTYGDALVVRALAQKRLGKDSDAEATLTALAVTMPKTIPDPGLTPPKMATKHQQILDELRGRPRVSLEISSTPAGADVVVDGRAAGKTPVVVGDLFPGTHFVALSAEGERVERKVVATSGSTRIDEKIGDARSPAAHALRALLANPADKDAVLDKAKDVGDDVVAGALLSDADGEILVVARVHGGALVVAGARLEKKSALKAKADALADALLADKPDWLGAVTFKAGPATASSVLTSGLPSGHAVVDNLDKPPDHPPAAADDDNSAVVFIGGGAALVAVVAAATIVAIVVVNIQHNALEVQIDASKLGQAPHTL